jgi:hypothetical protein
MPSLARNINRTLALKNGEHTELEVSHLKYLESIIKSHGEIKLSTIGSKLGG